MLIFVFLSFSLLVYKCTNSSNVAGNSSSETTNGFTASVVFPNGTAAAEVAVRIRRAEFLADTSGIQKPSRFDLLTDRHGNFHIDSLDSGNYMIEAADTSYNAALIFCHSSGDSVTALGRKTLSPMGTIQGKVSGTDRSTLFTRIRGIERCTRVDSNGSWSMRVPEANSFIVNTLTGDGVSIDTLVAAPVKAGEVMSVNIDLGVYSMDSLLVRQFLDEIGLQSVAVTDVTTINNDDQRIRTLDLSNRNLSEIPTSISKLSFLWTLNIKNNPLTDLPLSLADLPQFFNFDAESTAVASIPQVVFKCQRLQLLNISNTRVRSIPPEIGQLKNMAVLSCSDDSLSEIPDYVFGLPLINLNVARNRISRLPDAIGQCITLKGLSLDGNQIDSLPNEFCSLERLESLYAYDNRLVKLPDSIGKLSRLNYIVISGNLLTTLPPGIGNCAACSVFIAFNNQLTDLPQSITALHLSELNLNGNKLTNLDTSISNWIDLYSKEPWRESQVEK
jgi:internalin A